MNVSVRMVWRLSLVVGAGWMAACGPASSGPGDPECGTGVIEDGEACDDGNTIGLSDGSSTDNAVAGANGLDWDALTLGTPTNLGQVDWGSSEAGGMATARFVLFEYDGGTGYTGTVIQ